MEIIDKLACLRRLKSRILVVCSDRVCTIACGLIQTLNVLLLLLWLTRRKNMNMGLFLLMEDLESLAISRPQNGTFLFRQEEPAPSRLLQCQEPAQSEPGKCT